MNLEPAGRFSIFAAMYVLPSIILSLPLSLVVAVGNLFYLNDSAPCLPVLVDVVQCPLFQNTFISLCV